MFETQWRGSRTLTSRTFLPVGLKSPAALTVLVFEAMCLGLQIPRGWCNSSRPCNFILTAQNKVLALCQRISFSVLVIPQRRILVGKGSVRRFNFNGASHKSSARAFEALGDGALPSAPTRGLTFSGPDFFQNPSWRNWQSRKAQTFHVVGSNPADGTIWRCAGTGIQT